MLREELSPPPLRHWNQPAHTQARKLQQFAEETSRRSCCTLYVLQNEWWNQELCILPLRYHGQNKDSIKILLGIKVSLKDFGLKELGVGHCGPRLEIIYNTLAIMVALPLGISRQLHRVCQRDSSPSSLDEIYTLQTQTHASTIPSSE